MAGLNHSRYLVLKELVAKMAKEQ